MAPDNPEERLAPIGAKLIIQESQSAVINVSLTVYLDGITKEQAQEAIKAGVEEYFSSCIEEGIVRLSGVYGVLSDIAGIYDYAAVQLSSSQATGSGNLTVPDGMIPVLGTLTVTEGA